MPMWVHRSPRRALTLCPQLCMGIQPDARFPVRSADALPATLYGHFIQVMYRNRPIDPIKPTLIAPGAKRLKPKYDPLLSVFAFNFNLRHYTLV